MKSRMAWRSSTACGAHRTRLTPETASLRPRGGSCRPLQILRGRARS
jgi:hypothetical protein